MNIPYFLKKIFEEYNSKKINDQEYLQTCIENYTIKAINPELLFFCYTNNVLLEMLYNINLVYSYITNFNSIKVPSDSSLPHFDYKENDPVLMLAERRAFWLKLVTDFYAKYENCANIHDNYILDMLYCDIQLKPHLIEKYNRTQLIADLEKLVDDCFFNKNIIYFLLLKNILLEYFLNLLICFNKVNTNNITTINDIFTSINSINIKYPLNTDQLLVFWFNLNTEYLEFKTNKITYFFNH